MQAIPILFAEPGGHFNGSAILVQRRFSHWLLTAGHLPLAMRQPHKNWDQWPDIAIVPDLHVPLFHASPRLPRFLYLDCGSYIADIMIIPLSTSAATALQNHFTVFPLDLPSPPPPIGTAASAFGFVRQGSNLSDEQQVAGTVAGVTSELIQFSTLPPPGFSGGPLIQADNSLIGMTIGHDNGYGQVVSHKAIIHTFTSGGA